VAGDAGVVTDESLHTDDHLATDGSPSVERVESTAVEACLAGGRALRDAFRSGDTDAERIDGDVKSTADVASERRMLDVVRDRHPDHAVYAEESGHHDGEGPCRWIVDPLDGTNNFEAGLPSFAAAATALGRTGAEDAGGGSTDRQRRPGGPLVGVAYVPLVDDLYVARRGEGVRYSGRVVEAADGECLDAGHATVGTVIGHEVKGDPDHRAVSERVNREVETACKRRLESWSPTVHWGLLARGRLDAMVAYRPDAEEQRLGELFAREAGCAVRRGDDADWYVAAGHDDLADRLAGIVRAAVTGE
jgi:myo-inositol-1(or 4)-monophosphatase